MKSVTEDIKCIGVEDHDIRLYEGQIAVPNGMSYNSYLILDEKIAVVETVARNFTHEWLDNLEEALGGRVPDYLIVQHMEPNHSANVANFMLLYPNATVLASEQAFVMMKNFFGTDYADRRIIISDGYRLNLGKHVLAFVATPMVHWPEVMVTYDYTDKVLFPSEGFGRFGCLDDAEDWKSAARRYYFGVFGKYGAQIQAMLAKVKSIEVKTICPFHGPVLTGNIQYCYDLYNAWSTGAFEDEGVCVVYASVYGHTAKAANLLTEKLKSRGCPEVAVYNLITDDIVTVVAEAFRLRKLVLATITYNSDVMAFMNELVEYRSGIFPAMSQFIRVIKERGYKNRTVAMIENGSWSPKAISVMKERLKDAQGITYATNNVRMFSSLSEENIRQLDDLADELCGDYADHDAAYKNKHDLTALFNITYGLYLVTSSDGKRDNGLIVNMVSRLTENPNRLAVCIHKQNYSHHIIKNSGKMNVCCITIGADEKLFDAFGFRSGRNCDKFEGMKVLRSDNDLAYLPSNINSFMSLRVEQYIDLDPYGMFICSITEAQTLSTKATMTYDYYLSHIKPDISHVPGLLFSRNPLRSELQ